MKYKLLFFILILAFSSCFQSWKVPVGYKKLEISLGDNYDDINKKIGELKLDTSAENTDGFKNFLKRDISQVEINNFKLSPRIHLRFNEDELVGFNIIYSINTTEKEIDFDRIIRSLGEEELTKIENLISKENKIISSEEELWLRRIDVDTTSSIYPTIKYSVHAIP